MEIVSKEGNAASRSCPYCHTDLEAGDELHTCERCGAVHHADCWKEGGGCSVFGCQTTGTQPETESGEAARDDFTIQRRSEQPGADSRKRRIWLIAGVILGLLVLAAGVYFLLVGSENKSETPAPQVPKKPKVNRTAKKEEAKREAERKLILRLEPIWVDDPGGNWSARLPQGAGWTEPDSEGDLNGDSYNPLYRTTVWGPEGFVVIDTTPADDPTSNEANYTVAGELLEPKEISTADFAVGQMIAYKNGEDDCSGAPCVKAMLSDGVGGGVTIWVKSGSMKEAKTIARTFAETAERGY